uniref:Uncharacterized protein n=1 Tax=Lepeophtheirus salmonis TaxID=72036 RepID=A0A0K2VCT4_LEPSM
MDINPKNLESSDEEEDERKDPEDGTKTKQEGLFSKESLFSRAGCGWNLNYCCTIYINGRGIRSRRCCFRINCSRSSICRLWWGYQWYFFYITKRRSRWNICSLYCHNWNFYRNSCCCCDSEDKQCQK